MFLQETVVLNVMFFWKNKEVIVKAIGAIFYSNYYAFVNHFANIKYIIKLFVESNVFHTKVRNVSNVKKFKDLYTSKITIIADLVPINSYKRRV